MPRSLTASSILAGVVTLLTAAGNVAGQALTKLTVEANTDFAFRLYRQLAKENPGKNLFFSPYSISSALAMTIEGARGETAMEMGKVLGYPPAAKRGGDGAQLIPWETSLIHAGFQQIDRQLQGNSDDPARQKALARLDALVRRLAAAKKLVGEMDQKGQWKESQAARVDSHRIAKQIKELGVDRFELNVANALWGEQTYRLEKQFRTTIAKFYDSGAIELANFKGDCDGECLRINKWVEDKTKDRIRNLIPDGLLTRYTRLVLVNAIYFKGDWATTFETRHTKAIDFRLASGKKVSATTMHARDLGDARYGAFEGSGAAFETPSRVRPGDSTSIYPGKDGFMIAELPYQGNKLSMVLLAPMSHQGLSAVEQKITAARLTRWLGKLERRALHVKLPKFKLATSYNLGVGGKIPKGSLPAMGMVRAFTDPRLPDGADFTGMHNTENRKERLFVAAVVHKAFLDVNEMGTEAAAATAAVMAGPTSAPPSLPFTPTFSADRPFLLMIRHNESGSILFLGRMMDPTAANSR